MTDVPGATAFRYSAFISYPSGLRRIAARLRRDLHAVAKRHPEGADVDVFLDTEALRPGRLDERIFAEIRSSRHLIVLCGPGTAGSDWVRQEIEHWLGTVGSPQRLFLVRTDGSVDLSWDRDAGRFRTPGDLPEPLRELFDAEQKWIDYTGRALLRQGAGLSGLCAELMGAQVSDFLLAETAFQRRRTRIVSAVAVVTALLLVASVISGVAAVRNAAEARANAAQATAQADAAEALLAASDSPTVAIERALRAASLSDSPTVRSAMLAVSQATGRLKRALVFPEERTGHPVAGAGFSGDGAKLLAWGAGAAPGTSLVRIWDLATGAVDADVRVPVTGLRDVTRVDDRRLAACGDAGPIVIDTADGRLTRLDERWRAGPDRRCAVYEYATGVLVLGTDAGGGGAALSADRGGEVTTIAGVGSVAAHPSARSALLAGPAGIVLVSSGRTLRLATAPATAFATAPAAAMFADSYGGFLARTGPGDWAVVTQDGSRAALRTVMLPADATGVAPLLDIGRMTGDLAWITADGTLGWTRDDRRTQLTDSQGESLWTPYATTLEPLDSQDFVAVYRGTATIVRPPTGQTAFDAPPGTATPSTGWTQSVVDTSVGSAPRPGADPVAGRCADHAAVLLATTGTAEGGSMLVKGDATARALTSRGRFTPACDVVDAGPALSIVPRFGQAEIVEVRSTLVADSVAVSPVGDQVAVLKSGFPIEVLSTVAPAELPRPWDVSTRYDAGAQAAFGERELFEDLGSGRLVITDGSRVRARLPAPDYGSITAVRPDGSGAVVVPSGSQRPLLVEGSRPVPVHPACAAGPVTYLPGPDFPRSVAAAEAQLPAVRSGSAVVECRAGRAVPFDPATRIVAYDVGTATGRIVARAGTRTTVTTWSRGDPSSLRTVAGPALPPGGIATFDQHGDLAVTFTPGERLLTLHRRTGDGWSTALSLASGLPRIVAAQVVDSGTLVIAVSAKGGFDLFDVATGRLVASDPGLAATGRDDVSAISTRRSGDDLIVGLHTGGPTAPITIRIPVGIPALKRQLCDLYAVPECR